MAIEPHLGYAALAVLVGGESMGLFLPGETALLAAAVLAHEGTLRIGLVIPVAALAAIIGDNLGYLLARSGGYSLLTARGPWLAVRRGILERGERFFGRYGRQAVFLGRWIVFARVTVAWLAGASRMPWAGFVLWNSLGAVAWATTVGLAGFALGAATRAAFASTGVALMVPVIVLAAIAPWRRRRARRRRPAPHGGGQRTGPMPPAVGGER